MESRGRDGASKGIGASIARALADEGACGGGQLLVCSKDAAHRLVADISARGGRGDRACRADVSKPADIEPLLSEAKRSFGRIDILVNNAGVYEFSPLEAGDRGNIFHAAFQPQRPRASC